MYALVFLFAFIFMEFAAWFLHKYVMHGFLWSLHKDHHEPHNKLFQRNDLFAFFFAVPSFIMIFLGNQPDLALWGAAGYGIMTYGVVYFLVHEAIIHRRFRFLRGRGPYFRALIVAHRKHHLVTTKEGAENFGMLIVDFKYFREAFSRSSVRA